MSMVMGYTRGSENTQAFWQDVPPITEKWKTDRYGSVFDLEIDQDCKKPHILLREQICSRSTLNAQIYLYHYDDVPFYLKNNPYIKEGYRALLPASLCFSSLFMWNNETVNIWSHLIGFFIFFFGMFQDNVNILYKIDSHFSDRIFITVGLLCFQACMLLSTGYHIFHCHSEKACRRWLALDLVGITLGLIGCYLPAVHLAFYCHQVWRDFYMLVVMILSAVTLALQLHPRFLSYSWSSYRLLIYSSLVAYGIIPAFHWFYLNGGYESIIVKLFLAKIINMYILGFMAFLFYITKFPEIVLPGQVDYIGSSHQWWHSIVVVAFLYWHHSGEEILQYRMDTPCTY